MKKHNLIIVGCISFFILLNSCTNIYINEISRTPGFSIEMSKSKKFVAVASNELLLNEFFKTFNKKYSNNRAFINDYLQQFELKVKSENVITSLVADQSEKWDIIRSYNAALDNPKAIDDLFNDCNADYIIYLSKFEISNRVDMRTTTTGPNTAPMTSSIEYCIVKVRYQIIDKTNRKRVLEFESKGEAGVMLFAFEKALNDAIKRSIEYAAAFLKSGKKEF